MVQGSANDHACRAAVERQDFEPLEMVFNEIVFELPSDLGAVTRS